MLPSLVARDIERGLRSYIRSENPVSSNGFLDKDGQSFIDRYLEKPESLIKGPWAELKLPFRISADDGDSLFADLSLAVVKSGFVPYVHQKKAFERLCWRGAESTIIATGTGSGKTEAFLFPILDYCLHARKAGVKGIKAILIYPMNALAEDQARRLSGFISKLNTSADANVRLRAGLYTGDSKGKPEAVVPGEIIRNRYALRADPPDILLTNYKMLDFLLLRPEDQSLWKDNGPGVLRYLVVDELHTFDGAQGTDLACLIRRLRERLHLTHELACIGTSATIGGPESADALCKYASEVFAAPIDASAVIAEDRLSPDEFLASFGELYPMGHWPDEEILQTEACRTEAAYLARTVSIWFGESLGFDGISLTKEARLELGKALPRLEGFRRLIRDMKSVTRLEDIAEKWNSEIEEFREIEPQKEARMNLIRAAIDSLIAMIAEARSLSGKDLVPFINVRSQLWAHALSRAVVSVGTKPELALASDLPSLSEPLHLPAVSCRDCSAVAWGTVIPGGPQGATVHIKPDLKRFYRSWFTGHRDTALLYPVTEEQFFEAHRDTIYRLCPKCGYLTYAGMKPWKETENDHTCVCGCNDAVLVWIPDMTRMSEKDGEKRTYFRNCCPLCGSKGALRIFGAASTSLTAAVVDHLHASSFTGDSKIIAFSDSVQDAALRAGFFGARDFIATCRHALVSFLWDSPATDGMQLTDVIQQLPGYWLKKLEKEYTGGNQKTLAKAAFLATFMAPDKAWKEKWKHFSEDALKTAVEKKEGGWIEKSGELVLGAAGWEELYDSMRERLVWEVLLEIGFRSENGRTAARAGMAAAAPSSEKIRRAARILAGKLTRAEITFDQNQLPVYLCGLLHRFRLAGAFDTEDFRRYGYTEISSSFGEYIRTGNNYLFNMSRVLPNYGPRSRAPTAVTEMPFRGDSFNVSLLSGNSRKQGLTWFEDWTERHFIGSCTVIRNELDTVLRDAMEALEEAELLRCVPRTEGRAWVMPIRHWRLSRNVCAWRCTDCGRRYFSADGQTAKLWKDMRCHSPQCGGHLEEDEAFIKNPLYQAPPLRTNAREHTALIGSEERALIEKSFIGGSAHWSVNLLSATSTLEMGIDIGDLSSVILCSMPPGRANYLQRIGRAGRLDGNAIAVTIADRSSHDQYFWQSPEEMIDGEVTPPGVFLRAVSVLERQLTAFALGRWVSTAEPCPRLPENLQEAIRFYASGKEDCFPQRFLAWVTEHQEELGSSFVRLFDWSREANGERSEPANEMCQALRHFLSGAEQSDGSSVRPSLAERFYSSFSKARLQREDFQRRIRDITACIKKLEKQPKDEHIENEIASFSQQKAALQEMVKSSFDKKPLFNFFTDEGLLPNYAFPEEGVQVNSVIIKRRDRQDQQTEGNGTRTARVETFEFSRAAAQALHELAPGSSFYVKEHVLHVDQLKVSPTSFEDWRFCPECCYAERADLDQPPPAACPRCGNALFGDSGRKKTLLRVSELTATADARRDRIQDQREERSSEPLFRQVLIDVDPKENSAEKGCTAWRYADERFPFGFEFLRRVTIREINFGSSDSAHGLTPFRAAGRDCPQRGFRVCRSCGKVWKPNYAPGERAHDFSCKWYGKDDGALGSEAAAKSEDGENPWVDGLFLYREVTSEAIRIRIPVCDMIDESGAEIGTQSFIAAIKLGLRRHFKGAVNHLAVTLQTEPVPEAAQARNRFIVIYDTIPGGSGYLKDLGRLDEKSGKPEVMQAMFRAAWEAVSTCSCAKDPEKDGCYRCVFQYRDSSARSRISRREAESVLGRIAAFRPEQIQVIRSLSDLPVLDMSVLEQRLMQALKRNSSFDIKKHPNQSGEVEYEIALALTPQARAAWEAVLGADPGARISWLIRAQPDFRNGERLSRPDFVIRPFSETLTARHPELTSYIFTDGWEFHADKISEDAIKRQAILNAGHRVWSITWQDLIGRENVSAEEGKAPERYGEGIVSKKNKACADAEKFYAKLGQIGWAPKADEPGFGPQAAKKLLLAPRSSFEWLEAWMADPFGFSREMHEALLFAAATQKSFGNAPAGEALTRWPAPLYDAPEAKLRRWFLLEDADLFNFAAMLLLEKAPLRAAIAAAIRISDKKFEDVRAHENKDLRHAWAAFWQAANAVQFADRAWICTESCELDSVFSPWDGCAERPAAAEAPGSADLGKAAGWRDISGELAEDPEFFVHIRKAAEILIDRKLRAPDEIVDGFAGRIVCDGQGLKWVLGGGQEVCLFAAEDIHEKASLEPKPGELSTVIIAGTPGWIDAIEAALAAAKE